MAIFAGICQMLSWYANNGWRSSGDRTRLSEPLRSPRIKCLLPKYFKFSADFAIGGGKNDGNAETPAPASVTKAAGHSIR